MAAPRTELSQLEKYGGLSKEDFKKKWNESPRYRGEHGTDGISVEGAWKEEMKRRVFLNQTTWEKLREKKGRGPIEIMGPGSFRDKKTGQIFTGDPGLYLRGEDQLLVPMSTGRLRRVTDGTYPADQRVMTNEVWDFRGLPPTQDTRHVLPEPPNTTAPSVNKIWKGAFNQYMSGINPMV